MKILMLGILLFFGVHIIPACSNWREGLVDKFGENGYKGFFSIVSFLGLGLIIWGWSAAEFLPVYEPASWSSYITMLLMVLALIAVASSHLKGQIRKSLGDAMSVGVALWAAGHLASNGDWASILVFGSFLLYALLDIFTDNERIPAKAFKPVPRHDLLAVIIGVVIYGVLVLAHGTLFGPALV